MNCAKKSLSKKLSAFNSKTSTHLHAPYNVTKQIPWSSLSQFRKRISRETCGYVTFHAREKCITIFILIQTMKRIKFLCRHRIYLPLKYDRVKLPIPRKSKIHKYQIMNTLLFPKSFLKFIIGYFLAMFKKCIKIFNHKSLSEESIHNHILKTNMFLKILHLFFGIIYAHVFHVRLHVSCWPVPQVNIWN